MFHFRNHKKQINRSLDEQVARFAFKVVTPIAIFFFMAMSVDAYRLFR